MAIFIGSHSCESVSTSVRNRINYVARLIDPGPTFHANFSRRRNRFPLLAFPRSVRIIYIHRRPRSGGEKCLFVARVTHEKSLLLIEMKTEHLYVLRRAEVVSFEIWDDEWRSGFGAVNLKDVI